MNPRIAFFATSFALLSLGGPGFAAGGTTSLGTSKAQTAGGSNILKYSVMRNNSMPGARELSAAIDGQSVPYYLANGLRVATPAVLAGEVQIRPWKAGETPILTQRTGLAIAARLTKLIERAQRLHTKAEITDGELRSVASLQSYVSIFTANAALLAKHKVAVRLDQ